MSFGTKAKLLSGDEIPALVADTTAVLAPKSTLGYGTWQSKPGEVSVGIYEALKAGYRHLDLAKIYENQKEVAEGLHRGIKDFNIKREDLFITSKLWNNAHRPEHVEKALDDTLAELRLDYLDLYLIHWPVAFPLEGAIGEVLFPKHKEKQGEVALDNGVSLVDTWKALVALPKTKARNIGVSNFTVDHLKAVEEASGVRPAVNQVERHPRLNQNDSLVPYAKEKGIHITAYSAFGNNSFGLPLLITHPTIEAIANKHNATGAQVILAWSQVGGHSVIPKSVTPSRIAANFQEIKLDDDDVKQINDIGSKEYQRFNVPASYNPKWDINIWDDEKEKTASNKVVVV